MGASTYTPIRASRSIRTTDQLQAHAFTLFQGDSTQPSGIQIQHRNLIQGHRDTNLEHMVYKPPNIFIHGVLVDELNMH